MNLTMVIIGIIKIIPLYIQIELMNIVFVFILNIKFKMVNFNYSDYDMKIFISNLWKDWKGQILN